MTETPSRRRPIGPRLLLSILGAIAFGAAGGYLLRGPGGAGTAGTTSAADDVLFWTCSMHPEVKLPGPGKCPKCGMDLVPVHKSAAARETEGKAQLVLTPEARDLAEIETAPVLRKAVEAELRLTGAIAYDERNVRQVAAWFPGRVDRLFVDFTGANVDRGEALAEIYSPEIVAAQEELLQALAASRRPGADGGEYLKGLAAKTLAAAREKLRLLGLAAEQVAAVEKSGAAALRVAIPSPIAGTVVKKLVNEGDYVATGSPLYTVADLSRVWFMLDAYESDLPLLSVGLAASVTAAALPGRVFKGRVDFIDPALSPETRTARVRLEVENSEGLLKPGSFGYGVIRRRLGEDGRPPLVIPATAPLITGRRAIAYVEVPGGGRPTYDGKVIVLGPRARSPEGGDWYVVLSGLEEGQQVVTRGNFKIDSALQIQAKPSLMSPEGATAPPGHQHGEAEPAPAAHPAGQHH